MRITIAVLIVISFLCGCTDDVTPDKVKTYADHANQIVMTSNELQELTSAGVGTITDPNNLLFLPAETRQTIQTVAARTNQTIDKVQAAVVNISRAIKEHPYSGEPGLVTILETAQAVNAAFAAINPYAEVIGAGLSLAIIALGAFARKQTTARHRAETAVQEIVSGLEQAKSKIDLSDAVAPAMSAAQSIETQKMVAEIRKTLTVN